MMSLKNLLKTTGARVSLMGIGILLSAPALFAHGISASDKEAMVGGGNLQFIRLGATHMLTGYDHLLFLFGVVFFLTRFKEIVKFITAFTLGHSITLIFATFMKITVDYYLIDAVIAMTVIYKGFDNIGGFRKYLQMNSPNLVALVFIFGLIHGFGLSTRLQQLPLGSAGLLLKIISFNIGVELGQITALTVMLFLLAGWRKSESFARFSAASNFGLIVAGSLLLLMQLHGYSHEVFADELKFSAAAHDRAHLEIDRANLAKDASRKREDSVEITIPAGKGLEYKFHMYKGETLEYSWETGGKDLFYDLHGEDATGFEKSYEEKTGAGGSGSVTVAFEGRHGWYWKNKGAEDVKIKLKTKGSYDIIGIL